MSGTVAVILAGGAARRLGGIDKTLVEIGGVPILSLILERLRPQLGPIAIGANGDPARFASFGLPVLADRRQGIGPLGGLLRALDWATEQGAHSVLTVPGDTPFIPRDLLQHLAPAPAVAASGGRTHHLVALWPVSWREALGGYLDGLSPGAPHRAFGVLAFAGPRGLREVGFASDPVDPFFNVNTAEDRTLAQAMRP